MDKTQKLIKLIKAINKDSCVKAVKVNPDGSVENAILIVSIMLDANNCGVCIGTIGEICMTIQPLEEDAKIIVNDEYIEVTGSTSGNWLFYPDNTKSVFEYITEQK